MSNYDTLLRLLDAGGVLNPIRSNNDNIRVNFLSLSKGFVTGINLPPDLNCVEGECITNGIRPALYRSSVVIAKNTDNSILDSARTALVGEVYPDELTAIARFPASTTSSITKPLPLVTSVLNETTSTDITLVLTVTTPVTNIEEEEELYDFYKARRAFMDKGGTFLRVLLIADDSGRTASLLTRNNLEAYNFKVISNLTTELLTEFECGVDRSGIWSNAVFTDIVDIQGNYFVRGAVEGNASWSINIGSVCERTGSIAITNRGVILDSQGMFSLATNVPGRPYLEVTKVTPTTIEYLYRYYGINRLPYPDVVSTRNPANRIINVEYLCWGLLALSLSSLPSSATITLEGDKDAAVELLLSQSIGVLRELVQVDTSPRSGSIPAYLHADAEPRLVYGEEAERIRITPEVRLVEEGCVLEECLEVKPDPFNISREVSNLAVALYAIISKDSRALTYLHNRGIIDTGWLDGIPLDTSEPTGVYDAPTQLVTALAYIMSGDYKYLPMADTLISNARLNYYRNNTWNDVSGTPTARSVAIGALLDYITDNPLPNSVPPGPSIYQSLASAVIGTTNPTDNILGLVTSLNPTWFSALAPIREVYRKYSYKKERVLERIMSVIPFIDKNITTKALLQSIAPNIAVIHDNDIQPILRRPGISISAIKEYLDNRGYENVIINELWRLALYPELNNPTLGSSTLGLAVLEPPVASAVISVQGRFEDTLEVAMGVVLIRESCIDSIGSLPTQVTLNPVIDIPPLECTWEFWAGLHCCPT